MTELRDEAQAVEETVVACRKELAALQMTVQQQTKNRGGQAVAEGEEGSARVHITSKWRRGSMESEPTHVTADFKGVTTAHPTYPCRTIHLHSLLLHPPPLNITVSIFC